ncbi:ROK family transcriptional regulator [Asticcacaulis sp.]|uniref:ROK family transcriptional regulator n=1 Tax=Asticcacaulis sp. TaxID=1872648 RepID=UPI0031E102F1
MNKVNRGSNIVAVGAYNERLVLSILRAKGALSKVELTQETGLSKQTLTDVMGRLEGNGLLLRGEPIRGRIGQPQVPFSLNPNGAYSIGFKIGRKSYELVLMDFTGHILKWIRRPIEYPTPSEMERFVADALTEVRNQFPSEIHAKVVGMGVAMPNELWRWGKEFDAPEAAIEPWKDVDVQAVLERVASVPVTIWNDVASACNGELIFGTTRASKDFLYVYLGTFIGGGVVLNGKILRGSRQNAGSVGSMLAADQNGGEGRQLLSVASIIGLIHRIRDAGKDASLVWEAEDDWTTIDDLVQPWIDDVSSHLAAACINAVAVIDVPQIIIDGSVPKRVRDLIVERTVEQMKTRPTTGLSAFELTAGSLGYSARVIGAASLPMQERFAEDLEALLKTVPNEG